MKFKKTTIFLILVLSGSRFAWAGECKAYVQLRSASAMARLIRRTPVWTRDNFRVSVWDLPSGEGREKIIGTLAPDEQAVLVEKGRQGYQIIYPETKTIGWIKKEYVRDIVRLDEETQMPCKYQKTTKNDKALSSDMNFASRCCCPSCGRTP